MTEADEKYIIVGKIGAVYGLKGWLKIHSYTESGASILEYSPWYLSKNGQNFREIRVEEGKPHGKGLIAKLDGMKTPEEARLFTGCKIYIDRAQLPQLEQDEYYWSDLEGLNVIDQNGNNLGKVIYLIETGANDVLVVKGEKERAIPYLPGKFITKVDLPNKQILVDWEDI